MIPMRTEYEYERFELRVAFVHIGECDAPDISYDDICGSFIAGFVSVIKRWFHINSFLLSRFVHWPLYPLDEIVALYY